MLEFDKDTHTYRYEGRVVPHVTGALQALQDYAGVPEAVLKRKAEIGDAVHYATELYDKGTLDMMSLPEVLLGYIQGYACFVRDTQFVPLYT